MAAFKLTQQSQLSGKVETANIHRYKTNLAYITRDNEFGTGAFVITKLHAVAMARRDEFIYNAIEYRTGNFTFWVGGEYGTPNPGTPCDIDKMVRDGRSCVQMGLDDNIAVIVVSSSLI